jgi:signal transduction histidine kinase
MRIANPSPVVDWIVLTVRWVYLVSVSMWLALEGQISVPLAVIIIAGCVGNLVFTALAIANRGSKAIRVVSVVGDWLMAHILFFSSAAGIELVWVGLLPLVSAALYFRWIGAILVILFNVVFQAWFLLPRTSSEDILLAIGILVSVSLFIGLSVAYMSQRFFTVTGSSPVKKARARPLTEAERRERERRRSIYELISELSASLNYQRVLETSLDLSANTLDALEAPAIDKLVSAVLLFTEGTRKSSPELRVATSRRLLPGDRDASFPGMSGLLAYAIEEGQVAFSKNVAADPELGRLASFQDSRAAYCIPLRSGLDAYGILVFAHGDPEFFTTERREVLDIVGKQSVIAIQNARLYQDLEQEKNRMMEIQEESRKKLARDLHDGPTQSISAIAMRVNFARRLMERDPKAATDELFKIEDLARRTTKEIRHMLFTLRPLVLESQGLVAALESMAEKMLETYSQNVIIQADTRVVDAFEVSKQAVVFYLAEEATNNARKHAHAPHIWVRLKMLRDGLSLLEVEDDGVGFDVNAVDATYESRGSLGMINLRERTELVNGVLRIDSVKGRGTRIQVVIPLTEDAADNLRRSV